MEKDLVTMPISDYSMLLLSSMLHFRGADSLCLVFLLDLLFAYQGMHTRLAKMNQLQPRFCLLEEIPSDNFAANGYLQWLEGCVLHTKDVVVHALYTL
jgi:hypothetical protein